MENSSKDHIGLARTFKYLLATQFLSRGIPFIFNLWIVRHLTEADYAIYAVQFQLFVTCVLFLSREGFRKACLRADIKCDSASPAKHEAQLLQVSWMTFPLGLAITIAASIFVIWWQELNYSDMCARAILINGFACILELLAEPLYILSQNLLLLKLRLMLESAATLLRCITMYILITKKTDMIKFSLLLQLVFSILASRKHILENGVVFTLSQAAYGATLFLGYWGYFIFFRARKSSDIFPFRFLAVKYLDLSLGMHLRQGSFQQYMVDDN